MKKSIIKEIKITESVLPIEVLTQHSYSKKIYKPQNGDYLLDSLKRTGNKPLNKIVVAPNKKRKGHYWVLAGMTRLDAQIQLGSTEAEVIIYETDDEKEIENIIVDLNKQRKKDGEELYNEFQHWLKVYEPKKGVKGSRFYKVGKETDMPFDTVKDLATLHTFFKGDGEIILIKVFGKIITQNQAKQIKKVVETNPEKFNSAASFDKISNPAFDFGRLDFGVKYLDIDNDDEFEIVSSYLKKDISIPEFQKILEQLGKVEKRIQDHKESKIFTPILTDDFITQNTHIINDDNRNVPSKFIPSFKLRCLIGSPPYGQKRQNSDTGENETGHDMSGEEYGKYLAETYSLYKPYLTDDGSIYVIIDDYLYNGSLACSLEYFVTEMLKRGFYLVSRYKWVKKNPMPRGYETKNMVNGFEMVYRFVLDKDNYYTNPNLFLENSSGIKLLKGCTNHSQNGVTTRGGDYIQSGLKKLRNTLDFDICEDVIRSNVANPDDFFRMSNEKRHTSQYPPEVSAFFILEGSAPGDIVGDIWNGVGNTMLASLLTGRKYFGVEIENDYFQQTCRRAEMTEDMISQSFSNYQIFHHYKSLPDSQISSQFKLAA